MVTELFGADLKRRGVKFSAPTGIATDLAWKQTLTGTYPPPAA